MELSKTTWRHKYTSLKAVRASTVKHQKPKKVNLFKNPKDKEETPERLISKSSKVNQPISPPKVESFKEKLLSHYNQLLENSNGLD